MAVGIRVVAASTVILFLLSFLSILKVKSRHKLLLSCVPCRRPSKWPACTLQVFHNGISAELNPDASSLLLSLQTLEAQFASQKQRCCSISLSSLSRVLQLPQAQHLPQRASSKHGLCPTMFHSLPSTSWQCWCLTETGNSTWQSLCQGLTDTSWWVCIQLCVQSAC